MQKGSSRDTAGGVLLQKIKEFACKDFPACQNYRA
jgi:hypothetical protein